MSNSLKKGAKVSYRGARGDRRGTGKITNVTESDRGLWYTVRDDADKSTIKVRAAQLAPLR